MLVPTIHLNGTSQKQLFDEAQAAHEAVVKALDAVGTIMVHGRDFYPQGPDAINAAMIARDNVMKRLQVISKELVDYTLAIADGGAS